MVIPYVIGDGTFVSLYVLFINMQYERLVNVIRLMSINKKIEI